MNPVTHAVTTPDGRTLEVVTVGDDQAPALLYHHGQPGAAIPYGPLARACTAAGWRLITYDRPGYGGSTRRPDSDRTWVVADDVDDVVTLLDGVGAGAFVTMGWSGGGPRALACAALLPDRCRRALTLASVAPYAGPSGSAEGMGDDWFDGMAPDNVRDYRASLAGEAELRPLIEAQAAGMAEITADQVGESIASLAPEVDLRALTGETAEWLAACFRDACRHGAGGFLDDALVTMRPWGFDLSAVAAPVAVWQGSEDLMVPTGHGAWLAASVRGASSHLVADEGHLSLWPRLPEMLAWLTAPGS